MSDPSPLIDAPGYEQFTRQCEADYTSAELTAIGHRESGSAKFTNVFAVVELLHRRLEQNPLLSLSPKDGGYPRSVDLGRRAGRLYLQRWALPVRDALKWYRTCLRGTMIVPGTSGATTVPLPELEEDPRWPHSAVETHDFWAGGPFWGERPGGSRWHRLIPVAPVEITDGWNAADLGRARAWLLDQIHVDLLSRSVLAGSCHLRLPNPLYPRLTWRVAESWREIEFRVTPYVGADISTLQLTHWNRRAWGATSVVRESLGPGVAIVRLPEGVEEVAHAVICMKRGLLEQSEPAGFITSVQAHFRIASEKRTVIVPMRSGRAPEETYTVAVAEDVGEMQVGEGRRGRALPRLADDESQRGAAEVWGQLRVRWFDEDAKAGRQALRDIIGGATQSIDLLDPYFSKNDLLSFALATSMHRLPVRILTSAEMCSKRDEEASSESGEALLAALENVRARDARLSIEVRVMVGRKSPVHDRFLIVDGVVWVLGTSVNEFGDRGSLLLRLPQPPRQAPGSDGVVSIPRDVFTARWNQGDERCPPLEVWVKSRREARSRVTHFERVTRSAAVLAEAWRRIREVWSA